MSGKYTMGPGQDYMGDLDDFLNDHAHEGADEPGKQPGGSGERSSAAPTEGRWIRVHLISNRLSLDQVVYWSEEDFAPSTKSEEREVASPTPSRSSTELMEQALRDFEAMPPPPPSRELLADLRRGSEPLGPASIRLAAPWGAVGQPVPREEHAEGQPSARRRVKNIPGLPQIPEKFLGWEE